MMRWILLVVSLCIWVPTTCARRHGQEISGPPVGLDSLQLWRGPDTRPVVAEVWYPAKLGTREQRMLYRNAYTGSAAPRAEAAPGLHPVVAMSHGLAGSQFDLSWLAEALARDGFIVVAVHHNTVGSNDSDDGTSHNLWQRAEDLSSAVDALIASPTFGPRVDARRVALAGYSLGGSSVLVAAGAELDPNRFVRRFPNVRHAPAGSYHDARVRAAVALTPGTAPAFGPKGISKVRVPTLIVGGGSDRVAPEASNAAYYAAFIPNAQLRDVPAATHYSFTPVCAWRHALADPIPCLDTFGTDRQAIHSQIVTWTLQFLHAQLG
jgi:predicted dienelactone hydrolase